MKTAWVIVIATGGEYERTYTNLAVCLSSGEADTVRAAAESWIKTCQSERRRLDLSVRGWAAKFPVPYNLKLEEHAESSDPDVYAERLALLPPTPTQRAESNRDARYKDLYRRAAAILPNEWTVPWRAVQILVNQEICRSNLHAGIVIRRMVEQGYLERSPENRDVRKKEPQP